VAGPKKPTPPPVFEVLWHPEAVQERDDIEDAGERVAIMTAEEKLKQFGRYLPAPHSRAVEGKEGRGLRELRPRGAKSRWRPLYRQIGPETFVILAVAPEVQTERYDLKLWITHSSGGATYLPR
jgi:hypothetical protein